MKKIINNKVYDTDTAKEMATWDNHEYGNLNYCQETLYQKRTGEFFLHGSGGANSRYARHISGDNWSSGESIIPIPFDEARDWAERHISADEYEKIFSIPEEPDRTTLSITLPITLSKKLRQAASKEGVSLSNYIEKLIERA